MIELGYQAKGENINMAISDITIDWISGAFGVLALIGVIMGVMISFKSIKSKNASEKDCAIAKAVAEAKVETESVIEFRLLKESVNETTLAIRTLSGVMNTQMGDIQGKITEHDRQIIELKESAKQYHKRMDEHRAVDHRWLNKSSKEDEVT